MFSTPDGESSSIDIPASVLESAPAPAPSLPPELPPALSPAVSQSQGKPQDISYIVSSLSSTSALLGGQKIYTSTKYKYMAIKGQKCITMHG